jgi:hypothetical protein
MSCKAPYSPFIRHDSDDEDSFEPRLSGMFSLLIILVLEDLKNSSSKLPQTPSASQEKMGNFTCFPHFLQKVIQKPAWNIVPR